MIKPGEIQLKAREAGVRDQQIEKDYVLAWILKGIAEHKHLSNVLVFKGGTVLKKTYFEDYRYSEDLDFTLFNNDISNKQIFGWFKESFNYIKEEANIPLSLLDDNEHEDGGIYFYIGYTGPLGGQASNKKVKVDISRTEKLEFDPVVRPAYLTYSDLEAYSLLCYSLEEILVEKMRSIMQRMQARDFYDLWFYSKFRIWMFISSSMNSEGNAKARGSNHRIFRINLLSGYLNTKEDGIDLSANK